MNRARYSVSRLVLVVLLLVGSKAIFAAPLVQFTGTSSNALGFDVNGAAGQQFTLATAADITEIQICISVLPVTTSTELLYVEVRDDNNGDPSSSYRSRVSKVIKDLPVGDAAWSAFSFTTPPHLNAGKYWIVLRSNRTNPNLYFSWQGQSGNPYGVYADTMSSYDNGMTWPDVQLFDATFKVFGSRTPMNTTTAITLTPSTVARSGLVNVKVVVTDAASQKVQGGGTVNLSANDGALTSSTLTLVNGENATVWTAPNAITSSTITAAFVGHSFGDYSYRPSTGTRSISTYITNTPTVTSILVSPHATTTRRSCSVTAQVTSGALNVNGGQVTFSCPAGSFTSSVVTVAGGTAATTWNTPERDVGAFTITGTFSGYDPGVGPAKYASSSGSDSVNVDYTNVAVTIDLQADPRYPYINGRSYLKVEAIETATGSFVPGGSIVLNAGACSFSNANPPVLGGRAHAHLNAPAAAGLVMITATYPQYIANGYRFLATTDSTSVTAVVDSDGATLRCCAEYVMDYPDVPLKDYDLPDLDVEVKGFKSAVESLNYFAKTGHLHGNSGVSADHFEKEGFPYYGSNSSHADAHDIGLVSCHGNPGYLWLYNSVLGDNFFIHEEAVRSLGDQDLEWYGFKACLTMSQHDKWAKVFNKMHGICGFSTVCYTTRGFGAIWANLMIKNGYYDPAHKIPQAWFVANDLTQPDDVTARVIANDVAGLGDYLWGNGLVESDPDVDDNYNWMTQNHAGNSSPTAVSKKVYNAVANTQFQLDGSGSWDRDREFMYYIWDMDTAANSDSYDYDHDGKDEADDDGNVSGMNPFYVYATPGNYNGRLIVMDSHGQFGTDNFQVIVTAAALPQSPLQMVKAQNPPTTGSRIRIDVNPTSLPTVVEMDRHEVIEQEISYAQIEQIAHFYGFTADTFELDSLSNWNMYAGRREMVVNRYTGALLTADVANLYVWQRGFAPPLPDLPNDNEATAIAMNCLGWFGLLNPIGPAEIYLNGIDDICFGEGKTDFTTRPIDISVPQVIGEIAFQRKVMFRRKLASLAGGGAPQYYPVVGPGGKIYVFIDEYGDLPGLLKIWRNATPRGRVTLIPVLTALNDFQRLGQRALVAGLSLPEFDQLVVKDVSLGYYEADFVTPQRFIDPVYVLKAVVADHQGSVEVDLFLPATYRPLDVTITAPPELAYFAAGQTVNLSGSVVNGTPPYSYLWKSPVDGILGTSPSIATSLSVVFNPDDSTLRPHTVTLEVTDSEGHTGYDNRCLVISNLFEVSGLRSTPDDGRITLDWTNPTSSTFAGVRIQRKLGSYPLSPSDGTTVYEGTAQSRTDTPLTNGITYYYRVFAKDNKGNFSAGVRISDTPFSRSAAVKHWQWY
jgi:hypothetical protein